MRTGEQRHRRRAAGLQAAAVRCSPATPWNWPWRAAGRRERIVAREGEAWVHYGKDLRETKIIIGTGGVFVHNPYAAYILAQRSEQDEAVQVLRPRTPQLYLDLEYSLYAVGLLSESRPEVALQIFKRYITPAV
jgi:hypothetical protein